MRCRRAGTRQGAVTTASRDAGAQVRIIYVNASVMALGAARGVRRARVGLGTSRRWCSVFAHCYFALLQVVTLAFCVQVGGVCNLLSYCLCATTRMDFREALASEQPEQAFARKSICGLCRVQHSAPSCGHITLSISLSLSLSLYIGGWGVDSSGALLCLLPDVPNLVHVDSNLFG